MATFPTSLPNPTLKEYSVEPVMAFKRTQMSIGTPRQRLISSSPPTEVMLGWQLASADMATFITFVKQTINHATDYFEMTLDLGEGEILYTNVRFTEMPRWKAEGFELWRVSGKIEVEPNV